MNLASYSSMLFVVELVNSPGVEMLAVPPCSPGGMARCFLQGNQETPGRRESPESGTTPKQMFLRKERNCSEFVLEVSSHP